MNSKKPQVYSLLSLTAKRRKRMLKAQKLTKKIINNFLETKYYTPLLILSHYFNIANDD